MNQLTLLGSLKPTKTDIKKVADYLISAVENGQENPLELALKIKVWEELLKDAKEKLMEYSLHEIDLHGGKADMHGAKIERMEGGTKYDYSSDSYWKTLKSQSDAISEKIKEREELLKKIPQGMAMVDEHTGEAIYAPTKTSTTTIKITLGK